MSRKPKRFCESLQKRGTSNDRCCVGSPLAVNAIFAGCGALDDNAAQERRLHTLLSVVRHVSELSHSLFSAGSAWKLSGSTCGNDCNIPTCHLCGGTNGSAIFWSDTGSGSPGYGCGTLLHHTLRVLGGGIYSGVAALVGPLGADQCSPAFGNASSFSGTGS